jgi:hypothetical protein
MHPDVIAQTDKINEGSKRNLTEQKADLVGVLQKRQHDFGRFEAMKYFKQDDNKRLTWSAPIFTTQRRVRRMPMASNIRVILKKNFRARSCDGGPVVKKGGLILAIRVSQ